MRASIFNISTAILVAFRSVLLRTVSKKPQKNRNIYGQIKTILGYKVAAPRRQGASENRNQSQQQPGIHRAGDIPQTVAVRLYVMQGGMERARLATQAAGHNDVLAIGERANTPSHVVLFFAW